MGSGHSLGAKHLHLRSFFLWPLTSILRDRCSELLLVNLHDDRNAVRVGPLLDEYLLAWIVLAGSRPSVFPFFGCQSSPLVHSASCERAAYAGSPQAQSAAAERLLDIRFSAPDVRHWSRGVRRVRSSPEQRAVWRGLVVRGGGFRAVNVLKLPFRFLA